MSITVSFGNDHADLVVGLLDSAGIEHSWLATDRAECRLTVTGSDDHGRYLLRLLDRRRIRHRIAAVDGRELPSGTQHLDEGRFCGT